MYMYYAYMVDARDAYFFLFFIMGPCSMSSTIYKKKKVHVKSKKCKLCVVKGFKNA